MKITTFAIAFGPAPVVLTAKTVLEPSWLQDFRHLACLALGASIGARWGRGRASSITPTERALEAVIPHGRHAAR